MENTTKLAFSSGEAAAALGLSKRFVADLVRRGELKSLRIGRRRLIPASALVAFLAERMRIAALGSKSV
jgi:excisionase family DNA binding protein